MRVMLYSIDIFNTYSRERVINTWLPNESEEYKEMIVKWGQDYKGHWTIYKQGKTLSSRIYLIMDTV